MYRWSSRILVALVIAAGAGGCGSSDSPSPEVPSSAASSDAGQAVDASAELGRDPLHAWIELHEQLVGIEGEPSSRTRARVAPLGNAETTSTASGISGAWGKSDLRWTYTGTDDAGDHFDFVWELTREGTATVRTTEERTIVYSGEMMVLWETDLLRITIGPPTEEE